MRDSLACLILLVNFVPGMYFLLAQIVIGVIAGILCIAGAIPYTKAVITNPDVRPAKSSWIIWFAVDAITFLGMYSAKTLNWQMCGIMCSVTMITTLALIKGKGGWTQLEKVCIFGAEVGIFLWLLPINPVIAILVAAGVNLIGAIPTVISIWEKPQRENKLAWTLGWLSCVCAVIAIPHLTWADMIQPIGFSFNNTCILTLIFLRPLWLKV